MKGLDLLGPFLFHLANEQFHWQEYEGRISNRAEVLGDAVEPILFPE